MKPVDEMTLEEIRDELARMDGWDSHTKFGPIIWHRYGVMIHEPNHPIPATLDAAAELPDNIDFNVRVILCASDGSVAGERAGVYWSVRVTANRNDQEYETAQRWIMWVGEYDLTKRKEAISLVLLRLRLAVLRATKKGASDEEGRGRTC